MSQLQDRRGRSGWILVATLVGMAITARAGWWQLDRAAQKLALQTQIETQASAPVLPVDALAADESAVQAQLQRRVLLQGRWLADRTLFLDNRQMGGRPGFFVLTPLKLSSGAVVLVQRGWAPRDAADRTHLPALPAEDGEVRLMARVVPWPSKLTQLGADVPGPIRQNVDHAALAAEWGLPLRPYALQQLAPTESGEGRALAPDGLGRDWPQFTPDLGKHYGYAAQWFIFCAMMAGLYVWFQLLRPWRARRVA